MIGSDCGLCLVGSNRHDKRPQLLQLSHIYPGNRNVSLEVHIVDVHLCSLLLNSRAKIVASSGFLSLYHTAAHFHTCQNIMLLAAAAHLHHAVACFKAPSFEACDKFSNCAMRML